MGPVRKPQPAKATALPAGEDAVVLARFGAAHGVRGEIRLRSFTETPLAVAGYAPLSGSDGHAYRLTAARPAAGTSHDMLVVSVAGIGDRNAAEALNGIELSVPRSSLPDTGEDDFYHADLIGLSVETTDGTALGMVTAVENHGAGDLLEITAPGGSSVLVPFTKAVVPTIDIAAGRLVVDPPAGLLDDGTEDQP